MPANVTIDFQKAREKYTNAKTIEEKLAALEEMLALAPKHKGAENLRADITRKIKAYRELLEKERRKKGGRTPFSIPKQEEGQICIIGFPNSGKSTLLKKITNAFPKIAPYPFTTTEPEIGAMEIKKATIQVVELPGLIKGGDNSQVLSVARNADMLVLTILADDEKGFKSQLDSLVEIVENEKILLTRKLPKIKVIKEGKNGISIVGSNLLDVKEGVAKNFLQKMGYKNIEIVLFEKTTLGELALALDKAYVEKRAVIVSNIKPFKTYKGIPILLFNEENLKEKLFNYLGRVLVYTKKPSEKFPDEKPLVLEKGSTVLDLAKRLHKDFEKKFLSAKLYDKDLKTFKIVGKDYILKDGNIIELRFKK